MLRYILTRLALAVPTLLGAAVVIFLALRVLPGDVVEMKFAADGAAITEEALERERERLGLNEPLIVQFADWMVGLATLDFGTSMWTGRPVVDEIAPRLPGTLQIAAFATILAMVIGIPLGALCALSPNSVLDYAFRIVTLLGLAIPTFWLGMLFVLMLLQFFNWLPPITYVSFFKDPLANFAIVFWPSLTIAVRYAAIIARMMRSSLIEILTEDYIRTARAKGLRNRIITVRHGMSNAMLPTVTLVGLEAGFLVGGVVVTEQVFNINGLGKLLLQAANNHDYVLIQAIVMLTAFAFITVNVIVDIVIAILDPRVRYS
ncbi:ABC transporter permease [Celeribacter indicus]|uniref:Peptide ABC transporter permease n=1 Tax=Celeribacter indicus TaxID=1208324 RepID=A0A0B5E685_9RHOB|nr:ABC transporter permease [Celeribacter indicus]AJE47852.1 peptide ABC transporter permease [Celeribacter indicus]SDW24965.1 peptide/nickel transport system permease protein [Celeribacter indicus]